MCSSVNTLWSHLRTMHADEEGITKPTCSICGEDFVRQYQLKKHMALQVGSYFSQFLVLKIWIKNEIR